MKTLKEISDLIGDGLHGTPKYTSNGEYFFVNGNNLSENKVIFKDDTKKVSKEEYTKYKKSLNDRTLLLSINGTIGNVAFYNNEKIILGKSACYINIKDNVDKNYVFYLLKSREFQNYIQSYATGTTIKNVSLETIRNYQLEIPSINNQKLISDYLLTLDKKIELSRKINKTLQEIAKTLFKYLFIDFEPVKAKIAGKSSGLTNEINDLFPDRFEETKIGKIPKGWKIGKIENIAKKISEKFQKEEDWSKEKLIDLSRMPSNSISLNSYGKGKELSTSVCRFKKYDFLFGSIRPYFYKAGICPFDGVSNTSVFILRGINIFDREFLYFHSSSDIIFKKSVQYSDGTKMPIIKWNDFKNFCFALPNVELRKYFSKLTKPIVENIIYNIEEQEVLSKIRDKILSKLIFGKLKILNSENIIRREVI